MLFCLFVCLFWCLDYSRTNEQIFIKILWVGPGQRKKLLIFGKDLDHIVDTKNHEFPFQCILMILAFYLIFLQK